MLKKDEMCAESCFSKQNSLSVNKAKIQKTIADYFALELYEMDKEL